MKAGIKVKSRKEKEQVERALNHPHVFAFVQQIGDILAMPNERLRNYALSFYDSVLKPAQEPAQEPAQKPDRVIRVSGPTG